MGGATASRSQEMGEFIGSAAGLAIGGLVILVAIAIAVLVCWSLMNCFKRIPPEHRRQEPAMVWLLLIPCFNLVWSFFVFPKLAESYRSYFASIDRHDVGSCGAGLALTICIMSAVMSLIGPIPFIGLLNCPLGIVWLVILIIFLLKANSLKNMIPEFPDTTNYADQDDGE